jgi:hypothetical protein
MNINGSWLTVLRCSYVVSRTVDIHDRGERRVRFQHDGRISFCRDHSDADADEMMGAGRREEYRRALTGRERIGSDDRGIDRESEREFLWSAERRIEAELHARGRRRIGVAAARECADREEKEHRAHGYFIVDSHVRFPAIGVGARPTISH